MSNKKRAVAGVASLLHGYLEKETDMTETKTGLADHKSASTTDLREENAESLVQVFDSFDDAGRAYEYLLSKGYDRDEIDVVMSQATREKFLSREGHPEGHTPERGEEDDEAAEKKVFKSAGAMAVVGGLSGFLAALGASILLPGVGLIVAGPLAALGATTGALVGGIYGVPLADENNEKHSRTEELEKAMREGKILVRVTPKSQSDREEILQDWATR